MLNTYDNLTLNSIFRPKDFGRNIELRVKLSYVINNLTCRRTCVIFICTHRKQLRSTLINGRVNFGLKFCYN